MPVTFTRRSILAAGAAALAMPAVPGALRARGGAPAMLPAVNTRRVGELEVSAVSDGYLAFDTSIFVNISAEDIEAAFAAAFLDPAVPTNLGVTAHLVRGGGRTLLIDTGTSDLFGPTAGRLPAGLAALGVAPEDIDAVLITHLHPDHLGGLLTGGGATFPAATVHVGETELGFWTDDAIASQAPDAFKPFFARAVATAAAYGDRVQPFAGDVEVLPGITSLALPGHTVGHTGFRLVSGDAELLVFGDAANSAALQFAHPEAGLVFDTDPALAAESRKRLFDMLATDRTACAGTHMPFPGFGHVARAGGAYAWVPEGWAYQ